MKLYHFTAISYMQSIMAFGLYKGEMPVSVGRTVNAVNLTSDKSGVGHGLCKAKFVTPEFVRYRGIDLGSHKQVPMFPNKHKVRITLDLDRSAVTKWGRWAKTNVEPSAMKQLIATGGGQTKAKTWYFSNAPILPTQFEKVEVRQHGAWFDIVDYTGPWIETITNKMLMDGYAHWGRRLLAGLPRDLSLRLVDLIEHQENVEQAEAEALEKA